MSNKLNNIDILDNDEYKQHLLKKQENYKKEQNQEETIWDKLEKMCHKDMANLYYDMEQNHNYVYCDGCWFFYNKNNIVKQLGKQNPINLKKDIAEVLQKYLLEEYNNLPYEVPKLTKLYKSSHKMIGTNSYLDAIVDLLKPEYNDDEFINKLDSNSNIISFNNMLFDYKTKKFRPIDKFDFVSLTTKYDIITVSNKEIRKELNDILYSVFEDKEIISYWLNTISSALFTNKFESLYYHTGKGGNGKGLLFNLIESCLGDYFYTADNTFLTTTFKAGQANPTLASSKGKRILLVSEPDTEGDKNNSGKVNIAFVKMITGADTVTTRQLYQSNISFKPLFTCFLQCNEKPELKKIDDGIKRRIKVVDYPFQFKQNPDINNKTHKQLNANLKGTLKEQKYINEFMLMLIENAVKFEIEKQNCIKQPEKVIESTSSYIDDNDIVKQWLYENYVITNNKKDTVKSTEIYNKYCEDTKTKIRPTDFVSFMKLHILDYKRSTTGYEYTGIRHINQEEINNMIYIIENKDKIIQQERERVVNIIEDEKKEDIIKNEIKQNVNKKPLVIQKKKNIKNKTLRELDTDRSDSDE